MAKMWKDRKFRKHAASEVKQEKKERVSSYIIEHKCNMFKDLPTKRKDIVRKVTYF